ncbi:MAG: outer membrane protein assembly factor BamD [Nitrospiraceae bacterium]
MGNTDEQIFVGDSIEKNYDPHVIMKRAESFFERGNYPEAIVEYQHFLDLHRVHTLAPYAQYKLGESHFKMVKTVDRDLSPVYEALDAFEKLRTDYPGSRYEVQVATKVRECNNLIAQRYFLVGEFYYRREAYLAAAHRFEAILAQYPEQPVASDSLYYLALTYHELGAEDWAREKLVLFAQEYPNHKYRKKSRKLLAKLSAELPLVPETFAAATPGVRPSTSLVSRADSPLEIHTNGQSTLQRTTRLSPAAQSAPPQIAICRLDTWC